MESPLYTKIAVTLHENAECEITGEIPEATVLGYRPKILKELGKDIKLDGFRKDHIPEKVLAKHIGEQNILHETAEKVLQEAYPLIIKEHSLDVIGAPEVTITKLAVGNPIGFSIKTALVPEITLPDYKQIAGATPEDLGPFTVSEKEIGDTTAHILKSHAGEDNPVLELTDENVRVFGDFSDVADFKKKLENNLRIEKERHAREKRRVLIGEKIIEASTIPLPRILVEKELEKIMAQLKGDVENMEVKFDDYLKRSQKTEDGLRKEFKTGAEKRAQLQLVLNKIAEIENVLPDPTLVDREIEHIHSHTPKADPKHVRVYVESVLKNEAVFSFLENQKEKPPQN